MTSDQQIIETETPVEEDAPVGEEKRELPNLLRAAAVLLAINLLLGLYFWLSPNSDIEPRRVMMDDSNAMAMVDKPSPFHFVEEGRRPVKKAEKLIPILAEAAPAQYNPATTADTFQSDSTQAATDEHVYIERTGNNSAHTSANTALLNANYPGREPATIQP